MKYEVNVRTKSATRAFNLNDLSAKKAQVFNLLNDRPVKIPRASTPPPTAILKFKH